MLSSKVRRLEIFYLLLTTEVNHSVIKGSTMAQELIHGKIINEEIYTLLPRQGKSVDSHRITLLINSKKAWCYKPMGMGRCMRRYTRAPMYPKNMKDFRFVAPNFRDALKEYLELPPNSDSLKRYVERRQELVKAVEKVRRHEPTKMWLCRLLAIPGSPLV